jgi:hypothetical protein
VAAAERHAALLYAPLRVFRLGGKALRKVRRLARVARRLAGAAWRSGAAVAGREG